MAEVGIFDALKAVQVPASNAESIADPMAVIQILRN
jgi:hypothetical protein